MAARATAMQRESRRLEVLRLLEAGWGVSEIVTKVSDSWGCSRRTARRAVNAGLAEMVQDLDSVQVAEMLSTIVGRLERIARKAEQSEQYSAAVGACKAMLEAVVEPHRARSRFGRFGRSGTWT